MTATSKYGPWGIVAGGSDGVGVAFARGMAARGVNVWDGDNYAYELIKRFGLADSGGAVRASLVLYNDRSDVQRLIDAVARVAS